MDNFVYNSINSYFNALGSLGYMNSSKQQSMLVLLFYYNLLYKDYRGYVKEKDYKAIEKALNCLYGINCLIPYPDYLKMGKLKIGEMAEVFARTKAVEDKAKIFDKILRDSSSIMFDNVRRIDEQGSKIDEIDPLEWDE